MSKKPTRKHRRWLRILAKRRFPRKRNVRRKE